MGGSGGGGFVEAYNLNAVSRHAPAIGCWSLWGGNMRTATVFTALLYCLHSMAVAVWFTTWLAISGEFTWALLHNRGNILYFVQCICSKL